MSQTRESAARAASNPDAAMAVLETLFTEAADLPGAKESARFIASSLAGADGEPSARGGRALALLAAAAALCAGMPEIAEPFTRTRLHERHETLFGTISLTADEAKLLLDIALPPQV